MLAVGICCAENTDPFNLKIHVLQFWKTVCCVCTYFLPFIFSSLFGDWKFSLHGQQGTWVVGLDFSLNYPQISVPFLRAMQLLQRRLLQWGRQGDCGRGGAWLFRAKGADGPKVLQLYINLHFHPASSPWSLLGFVSLIPEQPQSSSEQASSLLQAEGRWPWNGERLGQRNV